MLLCRASAIRSRLRARSSGISIIKFAMAFNPGLIVSQAVTICQAIPLAAGVPFVIEVVQAAQMRHVILILFAGFISFFGCSSRSSENPNKTNSQEQEVQANKPDANALRADSVSSELTQSILATQK